MKRFLYILLILLIFLIGITGCAQQTENPPQANPPQSNQGDQDQGKPEPSGTAGESQESLGGVRLGMTIEKVDALLDSNFTEKEEPEDVGYFGEGLILREYDNGCSLVIGKSTRQVLQIDVSTAEYPTALGVKVGDPSVEVLELYRGKYSEFVGNQSPEKLAGWFETEPGTLLIFSSMENGDRSNENLTANSRIYGITLGRSRFFD